MSGDGYGWMRDPPKVEYHRLEGDVRDTLADEYIGFADSLPRYLLAEDAPAWPVDDELPFDDEGERSESTHIKIVRAAVAYYVVARSVIFVRRQSDHSSLKAVILGYRAQREAHVHCFGDASLPMQSVHADMRLMMGMGRKHRKEQLQVHWNELLPEGVHYRFVEWW